MGIKPEGTEHVEVPPDNVQNRWGAWEADLDATGAVAGEVHLETWSLADSANTWISENAQTVYALISQSAALGEQIGGLREEYDAALGEQGTITESISDLSEELAKKLDGEEFSRYKQTMESLVGEQGTLTKSISDLSGELDKKVTTSTFTQYEEGMEEQLWGENGELWRINNVLWDTQTGWNATQEKINATDRRLWGDQGELNRINAALWDDQTGWNQTQEKLNEAQGEINRLNDERNDLQDQVSALNTQMLESQSEFISRTLFAPGLQGAYDDYFSVTPSGRRWRVEAKGDWTGEYVLQSAYNTSRGWEPVLDFETTPRDDPSSPRVRFHDGAEYSTIIQYWVRQAIHRTDNQQIGHYTTPNDAWSTRDELTFTAPIDAEYSIYYRVVWDAASYDGNYSFRVLKNGATILQWGPYTHLGPLLPGQNGRRVRTINELNISLVADDVLTFQTYARSGRAQERAVGQSERKISWMMPYGSTWVLDTDGEGGFARDETLTGTVEYNWQESVQFLISDVVAGTELGVWDGSVYVTTPAGTVIPQGAWIRTLDPHPSSVTFRKRN